MVLVRPEHLMADHLACSKSVLKQQKLTLLHPRTLLIGQRKPRQCDDGSHSWLVIAELTTAKTMQKQAMPLFTQLDDR